MAPARRTVLAAIATCTGPLAGCSGEAGDRSGSTPTGSPSSAAGGASPPDRTPVASSRWIEGPVTAVETYSSSEPPVAERDEILALFDDAAEREEWSPDGEDHRENPERGLGEPVSAAIGQETYEAIQDHYDREEYYRGDTPGWIFDHDGTLVTLDVGKPS